MTVGTLTATRDEYIQDVDCCGPTNGLCNELTVETADGGGGWYLVLSTPRWALNDDADIDAFAALLKGVLAREPKDTP